VSRNLLKTRCDRCRGSIALSGPVHDITRAEAGVYLSEYAGLQVADASCLRCGARYIGWVSNAMSRYRYGHHGEDGEVFDLSYRSTFDDEPGDGDLPPWEPSEDLAPHQDDTSTDVTVYATGSR
jgi:hypothetical protein